MDKYKYSNKIGIAIITCEREDFFSNLIESIDPDVGTIYVINSGTTKYENVPDYCEVHNFSKAKKTPVGVAKDMALRMMYQAGHEFLFVLEDDIIIKDNNVFDAYVTAHLETGISHFNFHGHGLPDNGNHESRNDIEYENGVSVSFFNEILGAFSFFHQGIVKHIGYHESRLAVLNAFEHVEYTYRIVKARLTTPYRWFADLTNSLQYIGDQTENHKGSIIRRTPEWIENFNSARTIFKEVHGYDPVQVPDTSAEKVMEELEFLQKTYARPQLIK
jgi:hypothetical protein